MDVADDFLYGTEGQTKMAEGKNWIAGAIGKPGSLHKALGVSGSKKIPQKTLTKAAGSRNANIARKANLAKTLESFHH